MLRSRELASSEQLACRCAGNARRAGLRIRVLLSAASMLAIVGCQSSIYSVRKLPASMQAPTMPTTTAINLERMGGDGVGTSLLGPGDLVTITIVSGSADERVTPIPARIAQDGSLMVPLVGAVNVGGLEPADAERQIAMAAIDRNIYRQPAVTLTLTQRATNRVSVLGAVAKPGVVELPRGSCDLANAIAAAGGLAANAGTQVEVLHRGSSSFAAKEKAKKAAESPSRVQLASFTEQVTKTPTGDDLSRIDLSHGGQSPADNRRLEDRDVVNVLPIEKRLIHVSGLVRKPDQFELARDKEIRVLDAIAMAGGASSTVANKVLVIRQLPDMPEPVVIQISIHKAKNDGNENLRLAAGDLVTVEDTMATMTVDTIGKFFRIALGFNGSVAAF